MLVHILLHALYVMLLRSAMMLPLLKLNSSWLAQRDYEHNDA